MYILYNNFLIYLKLMTTAELITSYIKIPFASHKLRNIKSQFNILYSYSEVICYFNKEDRLFYITSEKFSKTTSRHTNILINQLTIKNIPFKKVQNVSSTFSRNIIFNQYLTGNCRLFSSDFI